MLKNQTLILGLAGAAVVILALIIITVLPAGNTSDQPLAPIQPSKYDNLKMDNELPPAAPSDDSATIESNEIDLDADLDMDLDNNALDGLNADLDDFEKQLNSL